jgi:hypothetical protein
MNKQFTTAAVALTLALIPLTAVAAYMAHNIEGNPKVSNAYGTDTITGEWRVVGTITTPQTKLDNLYSEYQNTRHKKELARIQEMANKNLSPVMWY